MPCSAARWPSAFGEAWAEGAEPGLQVLIEHLYCQTACLAYWVFLVRSGSNHVAPIHTTPMQRTASESWGAGVRSLSH